MKSITKLTCLLLFYFLIEAESREMKCSDKSLDYLLDNRDMIYQNFPHSTRGPNPHHPANINAGICCLAVSNVEVPVGSSARFASPNYPNKYPSDLDCGWNFKTDPGHVFDMKCHFKHLKQNDYLDMKENNSLYSYVENVKEKDMIHYFWHNEVSVGFHSDRETGVEGFECEIWPVAECAHPERVVEEEKEIESSENSLQFDPFVVRFMYGGLEVFTEDVSFRNPRELPAYLNLTIAFDGLINLFDGKFYYCKSKGGKCFYLHDNGEWMDYADLPPIDGIEQTGHLFFAVYNNPQSAFFGGSNYIYEFNRGKAVSGHKVPWADEAATQCLATDGETLYAVYQSIDRVYVVKLVKTNEGKSEYKTLGSFSGTSEFFRGLGCIITGNKIFITGVINGAGDFRLTDIVMSPLDEDINDDNIFRLRDPLGLHGSLMAIIDGNPAIVGGEDPKTTMASDTIRIFDTELLHIRPTPFKVKNERNIYQLFQYA